MKIRIFVLYHDEDSFTEAESIISFNRNIFIGINTGNTKYFENNIYSILFNNKELYEGYDIIGIIPYSLLSKMKSDPNELITFINENIGSYDILPIFGTNDFIKKRNNVIMPYIDTCAKMHGSHTFVALYKVLQLLYPEIEIMSPNHKAFFCNAFCTTRYILEKYLLFYKNTNDIIDKDHFLTELLNRYSYYDGKLSKEHLLRLSGYSYYTSHPFFFERLVCLYFNLEKYKICKPLKYTTYIFYD